MDGRMDRGEDGQTERGWMGEDGWTDGQIKDGQTDRWRGVDGRMDRRMRDGQIENGWTEGWTDGQMEGGVHIWTDRQMDRWRKDA